MTLSAIMMWKKYISKFRHIPAGTARVRTSQMRSSFSLEQNRCNGDWKVVRCRPQDRAEINANGVSPSI